MSAGAIAHLVYYLYGNDDPAPGLADIWSNGIGHGDAAWLDRLVDPLRSSIAPDRAITIDILNPTDDPEEFALLDRPGWPDPGGVTPDLLAEYQAARWLVRVRYLAEALEGARHVTQTHQVVSAIAHRYGCLIQNALTERVFMPDAFDAQLAFEELPNPKLLVDLHPWWLDGVREHLEIHSHGMDAFGLPDLMIARVRKQHAEDAAAVINELAASLITSRADRAARQVEIGGVRIALTESSAECLGDAELLSVLIGSELEGMAQRLNAWRSTGGSELQPAVMNVQLLDADVMETRRAKCEATLGRLRALWERNAIRWDTDVMVQVRVSEADDGVFWALTRLSGIGAREWRGVTIDGDPISFAPEDVAMWYARRRGAITECSWKPT